MKKKLRTKEETPPAYGHDSKEMIKFKTYEAEQKWNFNYL